MLLVRRFAKAVQRYPCYVKVVGLPVDDWEAYFEDLTMNHQFILHENRSYLCLQTESEPEANSLLQLLHNHTLPDSNTQLQACLMVTEDEETWSHPLFHLRADFAVQPEPLTPELMKQLEEQEDSEVYEDEKRLKHVEMEDEDKPTKQETLKELILANPPKVV